MTYYERVLSQEQAKPFLEKIGRDNLVCKFGYNHSESVSLQGEAIHAYPHDAGWKVKGIQGLHWLYIICPKCGYQWALHKLGLPRDFDGSV